MEKIVTIIIPCYNAEQWLSEAIESALAQTWPALDVIVINDGSTDDSRAMAESFIPRGVRVFSQPNRGASAARNLGLREARGDYIQYLDADDLLHPLKLERQVVRAATLPPLALLSGYWRCFHLRLSQLGDAMINPALSTDLSPGEFFLKYSSLGSMMANSTWLVPIALSRAAGFWDERLTINDDGEYFARIVMKSCGVYHCADARSYYRLGLRNSLSQQRSRKSVESAFLATELIAATMRHVEDSVAMRNAEADLWQRFCYEYYHEQPDLVDEAGKLARSVGKATLQPMGGKAFQLVRHVCGWKFARKLQLLRNQLTLYR